jgi:hypothetical protein
MLIAKKIISFRNYGVDLAGKKKEQLSTFTTISYYANVLPFYSHSMLTTVNSVYSYISAPQVKWKHHV